MFYILDIGTSGKRTTREGSTRQPLSTQP